MSLILKSLILALKAGIAEKLDKIEIEQLAKQLELQMYVRIERAIGLMIAGGRVTLMLKDAEQASEM